MKRPNLLSVGLTLLVSVASAAADDSLRARNDAIIVRALERMPGYDYSNDDHVQAAIARHIARSEGSSEYIALVKRFRPEGMSDSLQKLLLSPVSDSVKVEAAQLLAETPDGPKRLRILLRSETISDAADVAKILGLLGNGRAVKMLAETAADPERPFEVRKNAVIGLARGKGGENALLQLAESKRLVPDLRLFTGGVLARSRDAGVQKRAAELLPQPQRKDQKPLPPIDELAARVGDSKAGMKLFRTTATCANCHLVDKHGKEVGPNLSEIGSKLSREAMITSILDPSAGISHNYENYIVLTEAGQVINGLKVSETPEQIVIRTAEAIDRKIPKIEIEHLKVSEKSIMPENLHHTFDEQGLVDIVEYMTTLKKK